MKKTYYTFYSAVESTSIHVDSGNEVIFNQICKMLSNEGFTIQVDKEISKLYPSLSENHFEGVKKKLHLRAENHRSSFCFKFHQFDKDGKMPIFDDIEDMDYLVRCEFKIIKKMICELLEKEGFKNRANPEFKYAIDDVMHRIKTSWHYVEGEELPEYEHESYNARDRDGKTLYNGQIKYYRDRKGRLMCGVIYHNINNMWWVILNERNFTAEASFHFFDLTTEEDCIRKLYSHDIPHSIRAKKLRKSFNEKFSYKVIKEFHIYKLRDLIENKLTIHPDKEMQLRLKEPLKKELVVLKRTGLKSAEIKVNGSYFKGREAITFSQTGFIGFADWASGYNLKPFVDAFEEWLNWLEDGGIS